MNTTSNSNAHKDHVWLYDGTPEYVDLNIGSASPVDGGFVLALEFTNQVIRLAATRHPAKYVKAWRLNAKRYGLPDVARVLVAGPFLRYEVVKRSLAGLLAQHKDKDSDAYRPPRGVDDITTMVVDLRKASGV
jgi:hypothetical protein